MKEIEGYSINADANPTKHGVISMSEAIELFKEFPWKDEETKAEETGNFPSISFGVPAIEKHGEYINIYGYHSNRYSFMIEAFIKQPLFGFLPRWKSAFLNLDSVPETTIKEFITQLYKLPQDELFKWILNYKKFQKIRSR